MSQGGHIIRAAQRGKPLAGLHRRRQGKAVDVHALKRTASPSIAFDDCIQRGTRFNERLTYDAGCDAAELDTLQASAHSAHCCHLDAERSQLERTFHIDFPRTSAAHRLSIEREWRDSAASMDTIPTTVNRRRKRVSRSARRRASAPPISSTSLRAAALPADDDSTLPTSNSFQTTCSFLSALEDEVARGREKASRRSSRVQSAVSLYMMSMGETRVLTRDEEIQLFSILRRCSDLGVEYNTAVDAAHLEQVATRTGVSCSELQTTIAHARRAHTLVLQFNMRLVFATASKHAYAGIPFTDLLPEGMFGLEAAMKRFDETRGFKFSTLAVWHIRQKMQRCIQQQARVVRVPAHVQERLPRILRARAQLQAAAPAAASVDPADIATALGMDVDKVTQALNLTQPQCHLEEPYRELGSADSGTCLMDVLQDDSMEESMAASQHMQVVQDSLNAVLQTLQPRERNILRLRYGLNSEGRKVSRTEIADAYGLSQERIRQIEEQAVQKLTKPWRLQFLKDHSAGAV